MTSERMKYRKGDTIKGSTGTWTVWATRSKKRAGKPIELRRKNERGRVLTTYTNADEIAAFQAIKRT